MIMKASSKKFDPGNREIYRERLNSPDLVASRVVVKETDLLVLAERPIGALVRELVLTERDRLERFLGEMPGFRESLVPVRMPLTAPRIARSMAEAGAAAGVGPMAAVAGAFCEAVAQGLGEEYRELIIENGGDLYVCSGRERTVGIFAGTRRAPGSLALGIRVRPESTPLGICTSSGRIGHSLSFGDSAAATVIARSCALADAAATAVGNRVRGPHGIREGLAAAREIPGVLGAVILREGQLGAWGEVELVALGPAGEA